MLYLPVEAVAGQIWPDRNPSRRIARLFMLVYMFCLTVEKILMMCPKSLWPSRLFHFLMIIYQKLRVLGILETLALQSLFSHHNSWLPIF